MTFLFFALTFAQFYKFYEMPFSDYFNVSFRLYKAFLEQKFVLGEWGLTAGGDPIEVILLPRLLITLKYNVIALCIYFPLGIIVGVISAYRKGSLFDRTFINAAMVFGSLPTYITTFFLMVILGFQLNLFPAHYSMIPDGFIGSVWGLGIPIIALSADAVSRIARVIRSELVEAFDSEYYLLARTKGMTRQKAMFRHLFRNSVIPVLPAMVDVFLITLTGSFFVEMVFGIKGAAEILYEALISISPIGTNYILIDVNTVVIIGVFYTLMSLIIFFIVDISYYLIDPRIRMNSKKD